MSEQPYTKEHQVFDGNGKLLYSRKVVEPQAPPKLFLGMLVDRWEILLKVLGLLSILISFGSLLISSLTLGNALEQQSIAARNAVQKDSTDKEYFMRTWNLQNSSYQNQLLESFKRDTQFNRAALNAISNLYLSNKFNLSKEFSVREFDMYAALYKTISILTDAQVGSSQYTKAKEDFLLLSPSVNFYGRTSLISLVDTIRFRLPSYEQMSHIFLLMDSLRNSVRKYGGRVSILMGDIGLKEGNIEKFLRYFPADSVATETFVDQSSRQWEELTAIQDRQLVMDQDLSALVYMVIENFQVFVPPMITQAQRLEDYYREKPRAGISQATLFKQFPDLRYSIFSESKDYTVSDVNRIDRYAKDLGRRIDEKREQFKVAAASLNSIYRNSTP